jgi:hypothetical protein
MKSWIAAGTMAVALLAGTAEGNAQSAVINNGLVGAGVGAALGAIAGGGRGAATGALIGGTVGAAGTALAGPRRYYPYRHYVGHRGCHWIPAHHNRWGEWVGGHCVY